MSYETKTEYIAVQRRRYKRAGKPYKTRLLDEVCEVCGYDRKHAIKLLNGSLRTSKGKRGRKSEYADPELIKSLKTLWLRTNQLCGKRLKPAIPLWLEHYEKHHGKLSDSCREKLLKISPASIDRALKPIKAQYQRKSNTGTKPGTLLKNQIPIRTSTDDITRPGYLEADTVAHCGGSMSGDFIWSITYTDIGWKRYYDPTPSLSGRLLDRNSPVPFSNKSKPSSSANNLGNFRKVPRAKPSTTP